MGRETEDKIVIFGGDNRYDIPKSKIKFAAGNVLIDLPLYEIVKKHKVSIDQPVSASKKDPWAKPGNVDLATYERQYPKSVFNKGVRTQDEEHVGHIMKETDDKIVVWGHYDWRIHVPKSKKDNRSWEKGYLGNELTGHIQVPGRQELAAARR